MTEKIKALLSDIAKSIGHTPVIPLGEGIFGKDEGKNPAGSIKDRAAFYIIRDALESGALREGAPVVEATSGNTGIGLAYVCGLLGIPVILTMPESMSEERRRMLADYGAQLVLTPAAEGMGGAVAEAKRIAGESGGFSPPSPRISRPPRRRSFPHCPALKPSSRAWAAAAPRWA